VKGMEIKSNLSPRNYTEKEVCRIINPLQAKMYIKNKVYPIDIYTGMDRKTGKTILVMIFLKEETKEAYELWCRYELEEDTI